MPELPLQRVSDGSVSQLATDAVSQFESLGSDLERLHQLATLGTMSAGIAHEINNLLTPIVAYAQLALKNPNDLDLSTKALTRTLECSEALIAVSHALLKITSDDSIPEANVLSTLDAATRCLGRDSSRPSLEINKTIDSDLSVAIPEPALQQVFLNLLINANEAMADQGGRVSVIASQKADGLIQIQVTDTGPGIEQGVLANLFEPFVSTRSPGRSASGKQTGSGLGLTVCKHLLERFGGTISASSAPNQGATFTITLPQST